MSSEHGDESNERPDESGDGDNESRRRIGDVGYELSDDQRDAVAALASDNVYARQSKWTTFRELPAGKKWPYFRQHFLLVVVIVAAAVVAIGSLLFSVIFHAPDPYVGIQGVNMTQYATQIQRLGADFGKAEQVGDERLVSAGATMQITPTGVIGGSMTDDSPKLLAMIAAGQIQVLIVPHDDVTILRKRELYTPVKDVLSRGQLTAMGDALLDAHGEPATDPADAAMLDLGKSPVWTGLKGVPDDAVLAFANVSDDQHRQWAVKFVTYLRFS